MKNWKAALKNNCESIGCKNKCSGKYCNSCRSRITRAKDVIKYVFYNLRNRAKQRPKEFTITLPEFRQWCIDNNFPEEGYSVDRAKNEHGYHIWNIQKLKLIDNINKYHNHDKLQVFKSDFDEEPF